MQAILGQPSSELGPEPPGLQPGGLRKEVGCRTDSTVIDVNDVDRRFAASKFTMSVLLNQNLALSSLVYARVRLDEPTAMWETQLGFSIYP